MRIAERYQPSGVVSPPGSSTTQPGLQSQNLQSGENQNISSVLGASYQFVSNWLRNGFFAFAKNIFQHIPQVSQDSSSLLSEDQ